MSSTQYSTWWWADAMRAHPVTLIWVPIMLRQTAPSNFISQLPVKAEVTVLQHQCLSVNVRQRLHVLIWEIVFCCQPCASVDSYLICEIQVPHAMTFSLCACTIKSICQSIKLKCVRMWHICLWLEECSLRRRLVCGADISVLLPAAVCPSDKLLLH